MLGWRRYGFGIGWSLACFEVPDDRFSVALSRRACCGGIDFTERLSYAAPSKYPQELRDRAVGLELEAQEWLPQVGQRRTGVDRSSESTSVDIDDARRTGRRTMAAGMSNSGFLSYRRDAAQYLALALYQKLTACDLDIFYDIENIGAGEFEPVVMSQIAARPYFILLLTPHTLDRCVEPNDWLRREIEEALRLNRILVPIHADGFMPSDMEKYLPLNIATSLARFQSLLLPLQHFDLIVQNRLRRYLVPVGLELAETASEHAVKLEEIRLAAAKAPTVTDDQLANSKMRVMSNEAPSSTASAHEAGDPRSLLTTLAGRAATEVSSSDLVSLIESDLAGLLIEVGRRRQAERLSDMMRDFQGLRDEPIVTKSLIIGTTGVGKTTLVNALIGLPVGVASAGGVQSACPLNIKWQVEKFSVRARYRSWSEVGKLVELARDAENMIDITRRPDERLQGQTLADSLSTLFTANEIPARDQNLEANIRSEVHSALDIAMAEREFGADELDLLTDFVRNHTNVSGGLWPVTSELLVAGPFPGLSQGTELIDLPGVGDLNLLRTDSTLRAVAEASQLVVVIGDRGITKDVADMLAVSRVISYLVTAPDVPRVVFVGTKLDGTPTRGELEKLGLNAGQIGEVLARRFDQWTDSTMSQWRALLTDWSRKTLGPAKAARNVGLALERTSFFPSAPLAFLCAEGFEEDLLGVYAQLLGSDGRQRAATNVPAIRDEIDERHRSSILAHGERVDEAMIKLFTTARNHCESGRVALNKNETEAGFVDDLLRQLDAEILSSPRTDVFTVDAVSEREVWEVTIRGFFTEAWQELDRITAVRLLRQEYGDVHFQTFMAALRRQGNFESSGKDSLQINIPSQIGVYAAEPTAHYLVDECAAWPKTTVFGRWHSALRGCHEGASRQH